MNKVRKISREYADKNTCYANDSNLQYKAIADAVEYGYHQAEKDLELTWKDMKLIYEISCDVFNEQDGHFYNVSKIWEEVLKRFKERKEL